MSRIKNEMGNKYGELTVIASMESEKKGAYWLCQCTCGEKKAIQGIRLRNGETKTCGCSRYRGIPKGQSAFNSLYQEYKYTAKKYNRTWNITKELFKRLTSKPCFYCGNPPSQKRLLYKKRYNGIYLFNGLDRVDNTKGYTPDNVVPCCIVCNRAKRDMSQDDFFFWIQRISKNRRH